MRKILSFLALALAFTACQNEPVEVVGNGGLVEVVLNIDAPEMNITRTLDGNSQSGRNSALGAIDFFNDADWAKYDVRYILEVYDANDKDGSGDPIYLERLVNCLDKYEPTNFVLRLVPDRDYKFVVFADFVDQGNYTKVEPADKLAIADKYYDTTDLRNITAKTDDEDWNAMNEARDAYFVSQVVGISSTGLNHTLTLTRPFGKLRVIATDLDYIKGYATPGYVEVTYKNENIFKAFNAVNGVLSTQQMTGNELSYGYTVNKNAPYNEGYDSISTNQTLFADYILAKEGEQIAVNFKMAVYEDAAKTRLIKETDFNTQIPVQRNHLTTIIGDVLTNEANIEIKINDNFDDEFVLGKGDGNQTIVNTWDAGNLTAEGDYAFEVTADGNTFTLTLDGSAVVNNTLKADTYTFTSDEVTEGTFNAVNVKANDTRAMVDVQVIGGLMIVEKLEDIYGINLDLVLDDGKNNIRHASYSYKGNIIFGETLDAPVATATAEGNTITVAWEAVEKASTYYVRLVAEGNEFEATTELSKVYANLAWETEYTFEVYATNDTLTSVTTSVQATTEAEPIVETYNIYLKNEDNWEAVYFYAWGDNFATAAWPGEAMTATTVEGVDYYVYNLPAEATGKTINFLFNNGNNGKQTADISDVVVDKDYIYTNYVEPVEPAATPKYMVAVPAGYDNVIFCRMNPASTDNNWDNKWDQTGNLKVVDGDWYTINEGSWDAGTWSTFELAEDGYLYFTPNANWETANARFAAYFFGNGEKWVDLEVYTPAIVEPVEPKALATPVVTVEISDEYVTLSWEAIDGAKDYTATYGENSQVVEGTTATFDAAVGTYTATVVANPADTTIHTASEAGTIEVVVEAPAVEPEVLAELDTDAYYIYKQATEMKGGKWYAIVYENKAATGLTGNYGYIQPTETTSRANDISLPATCAFGFLTTDDGYTIQQFDGKYVYQTGSYDSFNVNANLPADGGVWSVAVNGNEYTITNNTMSKFVQYDPAHNSFGCYATSKGSLPTLYELVEVDNTPAILGVSPKSLSFASEGDSKTITVSTYGVATLTVNESADWVSTSVAENIVTVKVDENTGKARETTLTLSYGEDSQEVTIAQVAPSTGESYTVTYDFTQIEGFNSWTSSYSEHSVEYNEAIVCFEKANKQSGTITNMPVTKGNSVTLVAKNNATITAAAFECQQWTTKPQTITLYYSTDGGNTYTSTDITSTNFSIESSTLPEGTNAVKIGFSSTSNQVGIKSATITYK